MPSTLIEVRRSYSLELLGIPRDGVWILLRESAVENWGAGGRAAVDYDLGFEVNV